MFDLKDNQFHFQPNLIKSDVWKWKLAETIIVVWSCKKICEAIPFVPAVGSIIKFTSCICFGLATIRGIGEMSISQRVIYEFKYLMNKRKLHLRSPEYERKEKSNGLTREDKSIIESLVDKFAEKTSSFVEKYTAESESEDEEN